MRKRLRTAPLATIRDVAAGAGVSTTTVSRALIGSGRVGRETRDRVSRVAARLGYQPNDLARSLHGTGSGTIAVLVPHITNPFFPELVKGVQAVANEQGSLLLLCQTDEDARTALEEVQNLRRKRVDGVVLVGGLGRCEELAEAIANVPLVTVDRDTNIAGAPVVRSDHRAGGRLATEHLIELGHEQIAHIRGPAGLSVAQDRGGRRVRRVAGVASAAPSAHGGLLRQRPHVDRGFARTRRSGAQRA